MATTESPPRLDTCPHCTADIDTRDIVIEYKKDGQPAVYAECPDCRSVVNPK